MNNLKSKSIKRESKS